MPGNMYIQETDVLTTIRLVYLVPVAVVLCGGCSSIGARDSLLSTCMTAVEQSAAADQDLSRMLIEHNSAEKAALDSAFLEDLRRLSEKDAGKVQYQDVVQAKAIYDQRLGAILDAREHIREFFDRKAHTLDAVLDLLARARNLDAAEQQALQEMQSILGRMKDLPGDGTRSSPAGAAAH